MPKQIKGPAATKVDSKALPVLPPASPQPKIAAKVS